MEKKLNQMFDYQRFDPSPRLAEMIRKAESRSKRALSDDELFFVNAAGVPEMQMQQKEEDPKNPF